MNPSTGERSARAEDDLRNAIAATDIAIVFVDRVMRVRYFTARAAKAFQLTAADVGRSLVDLDLGLAYPELETDLRRAALSSCTEREAEGRDGHWYSLRVVPYQTAEGTTDGVVLACVDITRRRTAEAAALSSDERMRQVADSAQDHAIITTDAEGRITSWSRGAERIFGYSADEAIGQSGDLIFTPEDRERGAFRQEMNQALQEGRAHDDRWHVRSDGQRIFCSGITTPLRRGEFRGFAKIARDVTLDKERDSKRDELLNLEKASRREAQAAVELKDEFLAVMSHELKHPLNLILMNAELVARTASARDDHAMQRAAEAIRKTVEGQAQIIDDLLDLSRLNTGKLTLNLAPVNIGECIDRVVAGMRQELDRRGISLEMDLGDGEIVLLADGLRIEQVVWNLLSNAAKFSRQGGHVWISLKRTGTDAVLCVADDGIGMAPALLERAFDMFEQGPIRRNRAASGLGIGLALVRQLVQLHGGTITATSTGPNKGACFIARLPLEEVHHLHDAPPPQSEPYEQRLDGQRILVVDDSDDLLGPFTELLMCEGARVDAASSGEEALDHLRRGSYDILLSDIGMPGMDGFELIRHIRASNEAAGMLAVALTGFGRPKDENMALEAGFDAHLSKPVSLNALLSVLQRLAQEKTK